MSIKVYAARLAVAVFLITTSIGVLPALSEDADQDNWSGFSVSVGAGAQNFDPKLNADLDREDIGVNVINQFLFLGISDQVGRDNLTDNDWDAFGTAQIAFDQKVGNFVIGAFADVDFGADGESSYAVNGTDDNACNRTNTNNGNTVDILCPVAPDGIVGTIDFDYGTMWTVGGRAGYLISPTWLIYGLVAYSEVSVDISANMLDPFPLNNGFQGNQPTNVKFDIDKLSGLTLGAGTEFQIAKNVHFKLEYRFTEFDGEMAAYSNSSVVGAGNHAQAISEDLSIDLNSEVHSVRAAIVLKLGTP